MTTTSKKNRYFGILGLEPIREQESRAGGYKKLVQSQPSKGGKVTLKREYAYGLDESLFTSEQDREKNKSKFFNFIKKVELDVKLTDTYLSEMKAQNKAKAAAADKLSSLFLRKQPKAIEV